MVLNSSEGTVVPRRSELEWRFASYEALFFKCTAYALKHHMVYIHRLGKAFCIHFNIESNQINVALLVCVKPSYIYNALIMHKVLCGPLTLHWNCWTGQPSHCFRALPTSAEPSRGKFDFLFLFVSVDCAAKLHIFLLSFPSLEDVLTVHLVKGDDRGDQSASDRSRRRRRRSEDRSKQAKQANVECWDRKPGQRRCKGDARRCKAKSVEMRG